MDIMKKASRYDSALETKVTIYDHLPYTRNLAICSDDCIRTFSGNVIKLSTYHEQEPKEIPTQEELFFQAAKEQNELSKAQQQIDSEHEDLDQSEE